MRRHPKANPRVLRGAISFGIHTLGRLRQRPIGGRFALPAGLIRRILDGFAVNDLRRASGQHRHRHAGDG